MVVAIGLMLAWKTAGYWGADRVLLPILEHRGKWALLASWASTLRANKSQHLTPRPPP